MLPKPRPPDHALRKVEERCAIHKANVTIALLFRDANRIKKKRALSSGSSARKRLQAIVHTCDSGGVPGERWFWPRRHHELVF